MREEVSLWFKQAEDDLDTGKICFEKKKYYAAVFFCQQTIEKALKAYFIKTRNESPGTTHSLIYLAVETKVPSRYYSFFKRLTPQFVNTRYPDAAYGLPSSLYDQEIAADYIKQTEEIIAWIKSQLKK